MKDPYLWIFAISFVTFVTFFLLHHIDNEGKENLAGITSVRGQLKGYTGPDMEKCIGSGGMAGCPPGGPWQPFGMPFWVDYRYWNPYDKIRWRRWMATNGMPWSGRYPTYWGPNY